MKEVIIIRPEIDAEFASLIPPLSAEEYMQLEANIVAEGCRDRLVTWGNILIDGHNRLQICKKHNIPYEVTVKDFADRDEAMVYIILNQLGRRNLSLGNQGILVLKLEPLYKDIAKRNQQKSPGRGQKGSPFVANLLPNIDTREKLAEIAGISHTTLSRVKHIVKQGTPEQIQRIRKGGKGNAVNTVYDEVRKLTTPPSVNNISEDGATQDSNNDVLNDIQKSVVPPPVAPNDGEGDNLPETSAQACGLRAENNSEDEAQTPCSIPENCDKTDEIKQIRRYVADLKNPDLDRSFTTEMFLAEYEAFSERFARSIGVFSLEPYKKVYALLSVKERKNMIALGDTMKKAIEKQNLNVRNDNI